MRDDDECAGHYHDAVDPPGHHHDHDPRCGRGHFGWPWWCSRERGHDGPCALHKKPWRLFDHDRTS